MNHPNRTLTIFATLAILTLLFTTSLITRTSPTGKVTNNLDASVNLSITGILSITLTNSTINFGACSINTTKNYSVFDSNLSSSLEDNSNCLNGTFPDYLVLKNSGNVDINVTVKIDTNISIFFNDASSWLAYSTLNNSLTNGCSGVLQSYTNFTQANLDTNACTNLTSLSEFNTSIKAKVFDTATGGGSLGVIFTAIEA